MSEHKLKWSLEPRQVLGFGGQIFEQRRTEIHQRTEGPKDGRQTVELLGKTYLRIAIFDDLICRVASNLTRRHRADGLIHLQALQGQLRTPSTNQCRMGDHEGKWINSRFGSHSSFLAAVRAKIEKNS